MKKIIMKKINETIFYQHLKSTVVGKHKEKRNVILRTKQLHHIISHHNSLHAHIILILIITVLRIIKSLKIFKRTP